MQETKTFEIAVSANDAWVGGTLGTYPPTATIMSDSENVMYVARGDNAGTFEIFNGLLRFDTAGLPEDAVVSSASLLLTPVAALLGDADARSLVIEYYAFDGSVSLGDFAGTAVADAHTGTTYASMTMSVINTFALTNLSNINVTGYTGFRLHTSGTSPFTGRNGAPFASWDHATIAPPVLEVVVLIPMRPNWFRHPRPKQRAVTLTR